MDWNKIKQELIAPFNNVKWRMGNTFQSNGKYYGNVYAYIDVRDVEDRLDRVVGPNNWKNEFTKWHEVDEVNKYDKTDVKHYSSQLCGISIYDDEKKEWIAKWDGAQNRDVEGIKSGLSDSMKRAAAQWGVGRDVYAMDQEIVEIYQGKKNVPGEQKFIGKLNKKDTSYAYNYFWQYPNMGAGKNTVNVENLEQPQVPINNQQDQNGEEIHTGRLTKAEIKTNNKGYKYVLCSMVDNSNLQFNFISNDTIIVQYLNKHISIAIKKQGSYNIFQRINNAA